MEDSTRYYRALFQGLVYNEQGVPAEVRFVGGEPHYVVMDDGFERYVQAKCVDDAVLAELQRQADDQQEELVDAMLRVMGRDDVLTKAALGASLSNLAMSLRESAPAQWLPWLQMLGFRIIIDVHGQLVALTYDSGLEPPEDY
ncbi:MAG: hypothetical protein J7M15_07155 [Anaerolineae bacterium]|nr:hypothetical protein [Anaerolineae bacterium]